MGREDPQMKLRLPSELKDTIASAAKEKGHSLNAEIVARLETSERGDSAEIERLKKALISENEAYVRMEGIFDAQLRIISEYRTMLIAADHRQLNLLSTIDGLCKILLEMDEPPNEDVIKMVEIFRANAKTAATELEAKVAAAEARS